MLGRFYTFLHEKIKRISNKNRIKKNKQDLINIDGLGPLQKIFLFIFFPNL